MKRLFNLIFLLTLLLSFQAKAEKIIFYTENYPPYSFVNEQTNQIDGLSTEIVREIMHRLDIDYQIKMAPWKRGYEITLAQKNTCLYTTGKTAARTNLFQWITPFSNTSLVLFSSKKKTLDIPSISHLKNYRIGGYLGDATVDFLVQKGISVETVNHDILNLKKLMNGRIDLWATGEVTGLTLAQKNNVKALHKAYVLTSMDSGIACNLNFPPIIADLMQKKLGALYKEGVINAIYDKYLPKLNIVPVYSD